jgi:5'-nucleotidase
MPSPRLTLPLLAAAIAASCAEPPPPPVAPPPTPQAVTPAQPAPRCLSIVAWNDLHGQISPDDPVVDTGRVPAGGVVALADQVAAIREGSDDVVVLDAGDLFTGPLVSTLAEGAPVIEAYDLIGVDAAAIGNHEFDFGPVGPDVTAKPGAGDDAGPNGPRGALLARMAEARFPFLSANLHRRNGAPLGWPNERASTTITRGAWHVGVVGYTTQETPSTTLPPNVADLDFAAGAATSVAREIHALRAAGAAPVVLLVHASLEGDLPQALADDRPRTGEMDRIVRDLGPDLPDVIVAGHRHAWMLGRVRGVPIVSGDQHGVGLERIRFCAEAGAPRLVDVQRVTAMAGAPRTDLGRKVAAAMDPWVARAKPIMEAPVTTHTGECSPRAPGGTAMDDQVARATADHVADAAAPPAGVPVVGITNVGAIRAPLPPGPVRYDAVFTVIPFENTVAACGTTRAGLVRLLENALKKESSRERFPLGISGAQVTVKRAPDGSLSLVKLVVAGETKESTKPDAPVWIALSDFVLYGGDRLLDGVTCAPAAPSQTRIREAWKGLLARESGGCEGSSKNVIVQ